MARAWLPQFRRKEGNHGKAASTDLPSRSCPSEPPRKTLVAELGRPLGGGVMAAKQQHPRGDRAHHDEINPEATTTTDGPAEDSRSRPVRDLEKPPAADCGNCVYWLEPPPIPESAEDNADALRNARALGELGGLCRFLPQSMRKQASDWCGQHRYRQLRPVE
jgi:hypothetical protein